MARFKFAKNRDVRSEILAFEIHNLNEAILRVQADVDEFSGKVPETKAAYYLKRLNALILTAT